jgi:hypothetical protein
MTPLMAAQNSMSVYQGISSSQSELFLKGQGIPLAVISVDPNIGDTDFKLVRTQIREDWSGDKRLAVARAGTMSVETIGRSNKDMDVVASQRFNRDEIDTIYMGFPWRSEEYSSSEARKEVNREIRETVIYPLHQMLSAQMNIEIVNQFYGSQFIAQFADIRETDRAIQIQEANAYWRSYTLNEARRETNKPEFNNDLLPDLGELPYTLATDSGFVSSLYKIGQPEKAEEPPEQEMGNIPGAMDPEMVNNLEARRGDREDPMNEAMRSTGINMDKAAKALEIAVKNELQNYKTICKRVVSRKEKEAHEVEFDPDVVSEEVMSEIRNKLKGLTDEDLIENVFAQYLT